MPGSASSSDAATVPPLRGTFSREAAHREAHAGASGVLRTLPSAVAVPVDAEDLGVLVRWAAATGTSLVPRAGATGMPGGNIGAGVAVDLRTCLREVQAPDPEHRRVTATPGATLAELNLRCAAFGLQLPVDPSSAERCTLGGMVANNSAGPHTVWYGATRSWVQRLDLVLSDGSSARSIRGRPPEQPELRRIARAVDALLAPHHQTIRDRWPQVRKNASGYALREYLDSGDLLDLLVGSEGTLALVTGTEFRLARIPAARGLALLEFTDLEAAGAAVEPILRADSATCELLDRTFLELVRSTPNAAGLELPVNLEAVLLVEVEAESRAAVEERLDRVRQAVHGLASRVRTAADTAEQARLWALRKAASPLIAAQAASGRISMQFIEDGVVPITALPAYISGLRQILDGHQTPAVIFGHAGDGNLHVNPLIDIRAPDWQHTVASILERVTALVATLGGTMTGEHGDGRLRAPLLERIWGAEMVALFRGVKQIWDPQATFNPGVILPLPGQRPLDALRSYREEASSGQRE